MFKIYFFLFFATLYSTFINAQVPCALDISFDTDGRIIGDASRIADRLIALPDGSVLVAYNPFGNGHTYIRHINSNGSIDLNYGTAGKTTIQVASLRTDVNSLLLLNNELYICGNTGTGSSTYAFVTKLKSDGQIDITFGNSGLVEFPTFYTFNDMVFEVGTNKLIVTGMKSVSKASIARLHTNGYMDATFGNLGSTEISTVNSSTYYLIDDINIDNAGKYIITGKYYTTMGTSTFTQLTVMRFNSNGDLDNSFDLDGKAFYNSQASGTHEEGRRIFTNSQNEYYICGASYANGSNWNYAILKLQNDGTPLNSFGINGWIIYDLTNQGETETMLNAEMMSNGNLLLTGNQGAGDTVYFAMLMVKPDGSRDYNFAPNGLFKHIFGINNNSSSAGLALTMDGKIYLSGYTRTCTGGTCGPLYLAVARYLVGNYPNSIKQNIAENDIVIFPNPILRNGRFTVHSSNEEISSIRATNVFGQAVQIKSFGNHSFQIVNPIKGTYFLQIERKEKQVLNYQILVD